MPESTHQLLSRVRKPHVHITYEVFKPDGSLEMRELPFVVGVMGDFSGAPTSPLKPLREREFIGIDRDNFNEIMKRMTPGLNLKVKNTLADDGSEISVPLKFESMEDFEPERVAEQVPAIKKLLDRRELLREMADRADRSDKLEGLLEEIVKESEKSKGDANASDAEGKAGKQ